MSCAVKVCAINLCCSNVYKNKIKVQWVKVWPMLRLKAVRWLRLSCV